MIVDPDGCPGEMFLLDIGQVSRLVTHLRQETGRGSEGSAWAGIPPGGGLASASSSIRKEQQCSRRSRP